MKQIVKKGKRMLSVVLAVLMLVPGIVQSLNISALAADTSQDLYSFVVENCYSDQTIAASILNSGSLVAAETVAISYPESGLISTSGGKLIAENHPSGFNGAEWVPVTYTINGEEYPFVDGVGTLTQQGEFHVDALYQLNPGISSDMLNLPAILAEEAASQLTALNHLISPNESYMLYMEQMSYDNMETMYDALNPSFSLADQVVLNDDPQKNTALKESYRRVIADMRDNCYLDSGVLTLFDLLSSYEMDGLLHYYRNSATYKEELGRFNRNLNNLYAAEPENGLTAEDKEEAIERLLELAEIFEVFEEGITVDFADLRDTIGAADAKLIVPNAAINCSSSKKKLRVIVDILEGEAVKVGDAADQDGMIPWHSVVSPYGNVLILEQTVSADLEVVGHNYESVVTEPTCTEQGYTTHTCTVCGDSYVDTYVNAAGHSMGDWFVETEADCDDTGLEKRECSVCDYVETRDIEAEGHDYESVVTEPTCTEQGYTTHTCTVCGDSYVDTYVNAAGHSMGDWFVEAVPAYGEKGMERCDCNNCDYYETREITAVALVGETEYLSLDAALEAAAAVSGTVTLLTDTIVEGAVVPTGVTLNLADATLTADYVVGLTGSYMIANPNSGKLVVEKGNLVLAEKSYKSGVGKDGSEQYILPIWDPSQNCYLFSLFVANTHNAARGLKVDTVNETIYFQFRHLATSALNKRLLVDGASDNAVKVIVRLVWNNKDGEAHQDFVYNDEAVGKVTGDYDYSFTLTGYSALSIDIDTLTVTAMIVSDSGAIASGTVWTAENSK